MSSRFRRRDSLAIARSHAAVQPTQRRPELGPDDSRDPSHAGRVRANSRLQGNGLNALSGQCGVAAARGPIGTGTRSAFTAAYTDSLVVRGLNVSEVGGTGILGGGAVLGGVDLCLRAYYSLILWRAVWRVFTFLEHRAAGVPRRRRCSPAARPSGSTARRRGWSPPPATHSITRT